MGFCDLLFCVGTTLNLMYGFKIADISLMCLLPKIWYLDEVLFMLTSLIGSFCNVYISQKCSSYINTKQINIVEQINSIGYEDMS